MSTNDPVSRRALLKVAAAAPVAAMLGSPASASAAAVARPRGASFPRGFRWGCATAGHQIEGNNVNSDLWLLENVTPTTYTDRSGDACDSYHRFDEDSALVARFGLNTYRFSLEWARIEPTPGNFSTAELDHYKAVIESLQRRGIAAAVTFTHNSHPRWFAAMGGWLNPEAPRLFAHFCQTATRALGDGMTYAFTMNEPQVARTYRAIPGASAYFARGDERERALHTAGARATGSDRYVTLNYPDIEGMTPNLLAGHQQAYAAIKAERPRLPTSVTLNIVDFQPGNEGAQPIVEQVRERVYGDWYRMTRDHADFAAVQVYRQIRVPGPGAAMPPLPVMPYVPAGNMMAALSQPIALRHAIEQAHAATGKPVFVTENGLETDDDARRVWYIDQVMRQLHDTIDAGTPVIGYLHWSLLDNFEWNRGYGPHYGIVGVDRITFRRTPKPSAARLGAYARANALV